MRPIFALILLIPLFGCNAPPALISQPGPEITLTPTVSLPVQTEETETSQGSTVTIKIWIPPEFDPGNGSPGGMILQARLDEFTSRRSNIRIETRVKEVEGSGGMVDTLSTAGAAAPIALPDLIALPSPSLENAAIKGLLNPFNGLTDIMEEPDWYDYARQFSTLEDSTFGIPFAGDALIMVYRPSVLTNYAGDWISLLSTAVDSSASLAFPAADPNSLFTLIQYLSTGGTILDEENRPTIDTVQFTEVLTYYHQAQQSSLMPYWLTQYETDDQSWAAYEDKQTDMVVTWASRYINNPPVDSAGTPIPTQDGIPFTLATGWAWALASQDPERQEISAQLAEFLSTAEFLAEWTAVIGYIPPRSDALAGWENVSMQRLIDQVAPSARILPSMDVLMILGPVFQGATIDILKNQAEPISAAKAAADMLANP